MRIIFTLGTGVTIDTVPANLLAISTNIESANGLILHTPYPQDEVERVLRGEGFNNLAVGLQNTLVYADIPVAPATPLRGQVLGATEALGHIRAVGEAQQAPMNAMDFQTIDMGHDQVEQEDRDEQEAFDEDEEFDRAPAPDREFMPDIPPLVDINEHTIMERLPSLVSMEQASAIKIYNDKVREYERIWSQAITAKRTIDKLMSEINETEIVQKVKSDIEYLQEKCQDVDKVMFSGPSDMAITTNEIVTEDQEKYGSRVIGRMYVSVDMRYLYAKNPPGTNYATAIEIVNLDRHPKAGGVFWDCGHVYHVPEEDRMHVCFGGHYQHLFEAFVSRDLGLLFDTIMRFVKNPNEYDEWGCNVGLFPRFESRGEQ